MLHALAVLFAVALLAAGCDRQNANQQNGVNDPIPPNVEPDQEAEGPVYRDKNTLTVYRQFVKDPTAAKQNLVGKTFELSFAPGQTYPPEQNARAPGSFRIQGQRGMVHVTADCPKTLPENEALREVKADPTVTITIRGKLADFKMQDPNRVALGDRIEFVLTDGRFVKKQ
jgi:hypothetical protein